MVGTLLAHETVQTTLARRLQSRSSGAAVRGVGFAALLVRKGEDMDVGLNIKDSSGCGKWVLRPVILGLIIAGAVASGSVAEALNETLVNLPENTWYRISPNPSQRYIPRNYTASDTLEVQPEPVSRSYSGIAYGDGKVFYYGGGHSSYPGNDVEVYDIASNVWTQQYKPEVCQLSDSSCNGIYSGWGVTAVTPQGRPYVEHTYQQYVWHPLQQRVVLGLRSGTWTFSPSTRQWARLTTSIPWSSNEIRHLMLYDPDLQTVLFAPLGTPRYMYRFDFGTNAWIQMGPTPSAIAYSDVAATYDAGRKRHVVSSSNGSMWLYDARLDTWTQIANVPAEVAGAGALAYDADNQVVLVLVGVSGQARLWVYDQSGQWTRLSFSGGPRISDFGARFGTLVYDPTHRVFIFLNAVDWGGGGSGGTTETWAFRYKRGVTSGSTSTADTGGTSSGGTTTAGSTTEAAGGSTTADSTGTSVGGATATSGVTMSSGLAIGGIRLPTLEDERNTYRQWGWTWTPDREPSFPGDASYYVADPDIHGDTEGDDLWSYLMMYLRTGQKGYLDRARAWARYFIEDYGQCKGTYAYTLCGDRDYELDHLYGWGLVAWYEFTGDVAALAVAENLAAQVEGVWSGRSPGYRVAQYGLRQIGRHLLLATRVAEVTGKDRWKAVRDKLIALLLASPDWDARGMYFMGEYSTDASVGAGAYAAGARIQASYHIGIVAEALEHAYRTTGRTELRDRIVAMARFVDQYGLDPTYQYTGSRFGIVNGRVWHNYSAGGVATFWDPVYTTSLVNVLMLGYKYTGDARLYARAKYFFNRGTKGVYGSPTQRAAGDQEVHHFVDSRLDSSTGNFYLAYNRGELQYTYLLFGAVEVADGPGSGGPPMAPTNLRVR